MEADTERDEGCKRQKHYKTSQGGPILGQPVVQKARKQLQEKLRNVP